MKCAMFRDIDSLALYLLVTFSLLLVPEDRDRTFLRISDKLLSQYTCGIPKYNILLLVSYRRFSGSEI
jgi:hypothetical protein